MDVENTQRWVNVNSFMTQDEQFVLRGWLLNMVRLYPDSMRREISETDDQIFVLDSFVDNFNTMRFDKATGYVTTRWLSRVYGVKEERIKEYLDVFSEMYPDAVLGTTDHVAIKSNPKRLNRKYEKIFRQTFDLHNIIEIQYVPISYALDKEYPHNFRENSEIERAYIKAGHKYELIGGSPYVPEYQCDDLIDYARKYIARKEQTAEFKKAISTGELMNALHIWKHYVFDSRHSPKCIEKAIRDFGNTDHGKYAVKQDEKGNFFLVTKHLDVFLNFTGWKLKGNAAAFKITDDIVSNSETDDDFASKTDEETDAMIWEQLSLGVSGKNKEIADELLTQKSVRKSRPIDFFRGQDVINKRSQRIRQGKKRINLKKSTQRT